MIRNAQKYSELRAKLELVLRRVRRAAATVETRALAEACRLDLSYGQGGGGTLS